MTTISFNSTSSQITAGCVAVASAGALALQLADFEIPGIRTIAKMVEEAFKSFVSAESACLITLSSSITGVMGSDNLSKSKLALAAIGVGGILKTISSKWSLDQAEGVQKAVFAGLGIAGLTLIEKSLQK